MSGSLSRDFPLDLAGSRLTLGGCFPPAMPRLLADLSAVDPESATSRLVVERRAEKTVIRFDDDRTMSSVRAATDVPEHVIRALNRLVLDLDPRRLHLHGAVLERAGTGILLIGASGAGKSTLATAMVLGGARYLSDEIAVLAPGSRVIQAYPKPITVMDVSADRLGLDPQRLVPTSDGEVGIVASEIGKTTPRTVAGIVVFVRYDPDASPDLRPVCPPDAIQRLFTEALDARRFGPSSLRVLVELVQRASCWDLVHNDALAAAELVSALSAPETWTPVPVHEFVTAGPEGDHPSLWMAQFDDEALVIDDRVAVVATVNNSLADELVRTATTGRTGSGAASEALRAVGLKQSRLPYRRWRPPSILSFGFGGEQDRPRSRAFADEAVADICAHGQVSGVLLAAFREGLLDEGAGASVVAARRSAEAAASRIDRVLARLLDDLDEAGIAAVLLGVPVEAHGGRVPATWWDYDRATLLLPPEADGSSIELDDQNQVVAIGIEVIDGSSGVSPCWLAWDRSNNILSEQVHARSEPFRLRGRWCLGPHPTHRFILACLDVRRPDRPGAAPPRDVRAVVASAPTNRIALDDLVATVGLSELASEVAAATVAIDRTIPGLPSDLLRWARSVGAGTSPRTAH